MPQRTEYIVVSEILADDDVWDDSHEANAEGEADILTFEVRGATAAFLATAPDEGGISQNMVVGVITPAADADSTEDIRAIAGAIDEAADIDDTVTSFDVDGGDYENFQSITTPFRVACESERMLVTAVADGATEDTWTVIRGIDGTTAAAHLDDVAITHYMGPEATLLGVDDASSFAVNDVIKIATDGDERLLVTAIDETNETISVKRGIWGTTLETVIADNANIFDVVDDAKIVTAVASAGDLRLLEPANTPPDGDTRDMSVALLASDYS